jgi:RNA polymerase sigma-70 factor (ECF subfamily)
MAYRQERIREYERDLKNLRRQQSATEDESEKKILGSMISSTEYALFWLKNRHERMTGESYKDNRLNYKQREQLWGDIDDAISYYNITHSPEAEKQPVDTFSMVVEDFLSLLSKNEREAFILTRVSLYTHEETAQAMNISIGSVKQYVSRAKEKIEKAKKFGLQTSLKV